jgi:hypothetical protein
MINAKGWQAGFAGFSRRRGTSMEFKRITIFAGHYGSGKTNLAVNPCIFAETDI